MTICQKEKPKEEKRRTLVWLTLDIFLPDGLQTISRGPTWRGTHARDGDHPGLTFRIQWSKSFFLKLETLPPIVTVDSSFTLSLFYTIVIIKGKNFVVGTNDFSFRSRHQPRHILFWKTNKPQGVGLLNKFQEENRNNHCLSTRYPSSSTNFPCY